MNSDEVLQPAAVNDLSTSAGLGNNAFSRANVFGIFLALSFCLLTQPYGSVLYMKPSRIVGRIIFFFWKLNPLACAAEAFLILYLLLSGARAPWYKSDRDDNTPVTFRKRLHTTAYAILFLRGHTHLPERWAVLADERRWDAVRDDEAQPAGCDTQDDAAPATPMVDQSTDIVDEQRLGYEREAPMEESPPPPYTQTESVPQQVTANGASRPETRLPPPPQTREDRIESGQQLDLETEVVTAVRLLRSGQTVIGGPKLRSAEHLIHLISVLSVVAVIVKIAATEIPIHIHAAAWLMISGWATVEVVLAIARQDAAEASSKMADEATLLRCAFSLQSRLHNSLIWKCLYLLCLPVFLYLSHVAFFQTSDELGEWRSLIQSMLTSCFLNCIMFYTIYKYIRAAYSVVGLPRIRPGCFAPVCGQVQPPRLSTMLIVSAVVFGILIFLALVMLMSFGVRWLLNTIDKCAVDPSSRTCGVLLTTNASLWFSIWFFGPTILFSSTYVSRQKVKRRYMHSSQVTSLTWNLLITTGFFVAAMMMYDPEATYKPDWLDWLGRLKKWARGVDNTV